VSGGAATIVSAAGLGFGLPAPAAAAFSSTATASALQTLPTLPSGTGPPPRGGGPTGSRFAGPGFGPNPDGQRFALSPGGSRVAVPPGGAGASTVPGRSQPTGTTAGGGQRNPASGPVLAIGDSVMLGCAPNLEQRIGHRLTVDAVVGRQAEQTIDRLAQYRAAGRLPATVIVQIGDNGAVWYADMQHLRRVLKGVPRVILVNVRLARSWQNEVNSELKSYARNWPQAVIANWYTHSSQSMLTDGVHPTVAARSVYARVVVHALDKAERASRG
jgi:lysophospholipase L1-like esterase